MRAAIREAAAACVGVLAMKTQAGVYWDPLRLRKINMKAALKWVLQDEHVCSTVPAFSNFDELRDDLEVMRDLSSAAWPGRRGPKALAYHAPRWQTPRSRWQRTGTRGTRSIHKEGAVHSDRPN